MEDSPIASCQSRRPYVDSRDRPDPHDQSKQWRSPRLGLHGVLACSRGRLTDSFVPVTTTVRDVLREPLIAATGQTLCHRNLILFRLETKDESQRHYEDRRQMLIERETRARARVCVLCQRLPEGFTVTRHCQQWGTVFNSPNVTSQKNSSAKMARWKTLLMWVFQFENMQFLAYFF